MAQVAGTGGRQCGMLVAAGVHGVEGTELYVGGKETGAGTRTCNLSNACLNGDHQLHAFSHNMSMLIRRNVLEYTSLPRILSNVYPGVHR